jgi:hypothetical protein
VWWDGDRPIVRLLAHDDTGRLATSTVETSGRDAGDRLQRWVDDLAASSEADDPETS